MLGDPLSGEGREDELFGLLLRWVSLVPGTGQLVSEICREQARSVNGKRETKRGRETERDGPGGRDYKYSPRTGHERGMAIITNEKWRGGEKNGPT